MGLGGKKTKVALVVLLLLVGGYAAYRARLHLHGQHHYQAAQEALERRDFPQAGLHLKECLAVWPADGSIRLLAAQTARRRGDFDEARQELRVCERLQAPEKERLRELQLLFVQKGDLPQTDELLDVCIKDSQASGAYLILEVVIDRKVMDLERAYNAGITLIEGPAGQDRIRTERAIALWCDLRAGKSDQAQGLVWRGKIHLLTDQQAAVPDFRKALDIEPDHFDARLHLAAALVDYDGREAARHLEILRQRDPKNNQVSILLASLYRGLGRLTDAQQVLDEVLSVNPENVAALLERGKTTLDAGHPAEAEQFLRAALALEPNEPGIHLSLSRCLHLTGREEEAKHHQQRYSDLESERTRAARARAEEEREAWRKRLEQGERREETYPR